jgi:solute carrier family 44 protein 1 (choline transporter-like protein)
MEFISRNGYIQVSIHGCNFCVGCFKAFTLLANNILRVAAINTVGDFVLFLGKLVVVVATVFIGIEIVDLRSQEDGKVNHVWAPVALAAIFAYLTASCFIGVYEVSSFFPLYKKNLVLCILCN